MNKGEVEGLLERVRERCRQFPEIEERPSHGAPGFFIRGKKTLAMFHDGHRHGHHSDGRVSIWCPAPEGAQDAMIDMDPGRFFAPPYVGPRGWVGMFVDDDVDWDQVDEVLEQAFRKAAPKTLVRRWEEGQA